MLASRPAPIVARVIRVLRVQNLATIEELELWLGPGLNVVTGETGAGKSVLLGAVAMLCGRRVSSSIVRSGADAARVEAILETPVLLARAASLGLADEGADEILVARSVSREARGRVFINGRLATVALLGELLGDQLEVVSQGEHQQLMRPEVQAELLDRYGRLGPLADEVAGLHARWREVAGEIHARRANAEELARRSDQLRYEIEQIERAAPRPEELEELEAEHGRLAHVERLGQAGSASIESLEGESGASERVSAALSTLRAVADLDPALREPVEALERAAVELGEAGALLERYATSLEADPGRLEQVEARLSELRRLQSRYGPSIAAILAHHEAAAEELARIGGGEARSAELEASLADLGQVLEGAAGRLGAARREVAAELEERVSRELAVLDLQRARFCVGFEPLRSKTSEGLEAPSGPAGRERASFRLSANPGEEPRSLRDAASGGELARLLLALRNVLREAEPGRLLLFDEIDAGVGGRTARRVGDRLRALASRHQIVCITHLPQIAAQAETHYRVHKQVRAGRSRTRVSALEGDARVDEIARMSGGGRLTAVARAHARELLARG